MRFKGLYLLVIITLILQPVSFTLAQEQVDEPGQSQSLFFPMLASQIPTVIPDTTKVLPNDALQSLEEISEDGSTYTFSQDSAALQDLEAGDVMVGDPVDEAPDGFLRLVTGVTESGGNVVVETEQATLEDAIQSGSVHAQVPLSPADVRESSLTEGVEMVMLPGSTDGLSFAYNINLILYDADGDTEKTTNDQIVAKGLLAFEQNFNFDVSVNWFKLEYLAFYITAEETAELSIETDLVSVELKKKWEIAKHTFSPIKFMVGVVPVWITPELTISIGLDGEVYVSMEAGVTQKATAKAGLMYANPKWSPIMEFGNSFVFNPPTLTPGISAKLFGSIELALKIYGVAGPKAEAQPYIMAVAEVGREPWWELFLGFDLSVGIEFKVLSKVLAQISQPVIEWKHTLLAANIPPEEPSDPSPPDGAIDQSLNTNLSWTASDDDDDALTYDVYLEADDDNPDVLVCQNTPTASCTPGGLNPLTTYYWQVIVRDADGDTADGAVWSFTTERATPGDFSKLSPPDGEVDLPTDLILNWEDSQDALWYEYCYVLEGAGECSNWTNTGTISQVILNDLLEQRTYHWQVRAINAYGTAYANGDASAAWSFTTGEDITSETVLVPAGDFWMGTDNYEFSDAEPQHLVTLSEYVIDKYEVTNAQYARCVTAGVCSKPDSEGSLEDFYAHAAEYLDYPVNYVKWEYANDYCTWAEMRLPTEAEWEKAARGINTIENWPLYPWGHQDPNCSLANYRGVYVDYYPYYLACVGGPTRVGSYTYGASPYGIMDMAGNIAEWVSDWYDADYYATSPTVDPTGPDSGTEKVLRGGHWDLYYWIDVNYRGHASAMSEPYSSGYTGFRCAGSPPSP